MAKAQKSVAKDAGRIRGPDIRAFIRVAYGVSALEALKVADAENRTLVSSFRLGPELVDKLNVHTSPWTHGQKAHDSNIETKREILSCLPAWSGTMTGYSKPGEKFGAAVEYTDEKTGMTLVFPVPAEYRQLKNGILVAEHPDYSLVPDDGNRLVVNAEKAGLVEDFPASSGIFCIDREYRMPHGRKIVDRWDRSSYERRYLDRLDGARVGLVARDCSLNREYGLYSEWSINLSTPLSSRLGMFVEGDWSETIQPFSDSKLRVIIEAERLMAEGTPLQLDAVLRTLEQLGIRLDRIDRR